MREWLKRSPWKGDGVARLPRVRIPLLPPMEIRYISKQEYKEYLEKDMDRLNKDLLRFSKVRAGTRFEVMDALPLAEVSDLYKNLDE